MSAKKRKTELSEEERRIIEKFSTTGNVEEELKIAQKKSKNRRPLTPWEEQEQQLEWHQQRNRHRRKRGIREEFSLLKNAPGMMLYNVFLIIYYAGLFWLLWPSIEPHFQQILQLIPLLLMFFPAHFLARRTAAFIWNAFNR